jgi:hypothetical protein
MEASKLPFLVRLALVGALTWTPAAAWSAPWRDEGGERARDFAAQREAETSGELARLLAPFGIAVEAPAVAARSWRELELSWSRPKGDVDAATGERPAERPLTIRRERVARAAPARPRALELAETQILVVATDTLRQLTWWTVVPDPRLFRAETVDDEGNLVDGGALYRGAVGFRLEIPSDREIAQLEVYHPRWNGTEFELDPVAAVARARQQGGVR